MVASRHVSRQAEPEGEQQPPLAPAVFHHLQRERAHAREVVHPEGLGRGLRRVHEERDGRQD